MSALLSGTFPPPCPPLKPFGRGAGGAALSLSKGLGQIPLWQREWKGAQGLAEDVRYYGQWMREEAEKRIGHLYPPYEITAELLAARPDLKAQGLKAGDKLTVIAWLWVRTVRCPSPACGAQMPMAASFVLSSKKGKQAWVEPLVDQAKKQVQFTVRVGLGSPPPPPKAGRGAQFRCLVCGQLAPEEAIRAEFRAKRSSAQMMAIVAEGKNGRVYLPPNEEHCCVAESAQPAWKPEEEMNTQTPNLVSGRGYGITHWHELFTPRQLTALTTFSDLVGEARQKVLEDVRTLLWFERQLLSGSGNAPHPQPFSQRARGGCPHPRPLSQRARGVKLPSPKMGEGLGMGESPVELVETQYSISPIPNPLSRFDHPIPCRPG